MARLVIVSNRVPAPRDRNQSAGGLAVALRDAVRRRDCLWFGWSGNVVTTNTPPEPRITLAGRITFATLDLSESDYRGYYRGFANGMLWPLLHSRVGLSEFRRNDFMAYNTVNAVFARALAPLLLPDDLIWVHDYHLFPLGQALRDREIACPVGFFLHVPFPPPALFNCLPQADTLLRMLAAYNVVGVQVAEDAENLNALLHKLNIPICASAFPVGIDPEAFSKAARRAQNGPEVIRLAESLIGRTLILGVDRLDYSKGLPHRFRGFSQLLRRFPECRKHVRYLQIAPVSRGDVAQYRALRRELDELVGTIDGEYADFDGTPLRYLTRSVGRATLAGFYRLAHVGLVTPLRDGMNLVAKEYVAAQKPDDPGVLVLSRFAGAAQELDGAILVNPHDPDEIAEALHAALTMPREDRQARWRTMREAVWRNTAGAWAARFLSELEHPASQRPSRMWVLPHFPCYLQALKAAIPLI
jgi:trehalose 6-phosphate synthase